MPLTGFSSGGPKMNNSTRNLKMKKLLIASTALVATAGMAAADITVTGHAQAGYHSQLLTKGGASQSTTSEGIYSGVGVDFAMSGATDNGISFSASLNIDAGTEIDQADFQYDGADGGTAGLGAVTMSGAFGTLTFDDGGVGNLFDGDYSNHDISYATTVNGVAISVAADADESVAAGAAGTDDASASASVAAGDMTYTLTASNHATNGMSTKVAVAYTVNDMLSVNANSKSLSAAGSKTVAGVGATIVANGLTVTVASDNAQPNSGWDLDLAYSLGGVALTYGTDENSSHDLTATYALGGGATFKAGMRNHGTAAAKAAYKDSLYAGVSFAF